MQARRMRNNWLTRQIHVLIRHMKPSISPTRIGILVFPACMPSCAVTPHDVFVVANTLLQNRPAFEATRFVVQWVSVHGGVVNVSSGMSFVTQACDLAQLDALFVPGIAHQRVADLMASIAEMVEEQALLLECMRQDKLLATNCSSSFLLASTGQLSGKRVTTSWWLASAFSQLYPDVTLVSDELLVQDGALLTSGGVTAALDLALSLVAHFASEELRQLTAKLLVTDSHRSSQAPYIANALLQGEGHALVERAQRWLNRHMTQEWQMAQLAQYCHTSPRTLLRHFQKACGVSPILYMQQLRVERAKTLLETSLLSLEEITAQCGYLDVPSFSKVFKRWAQLTPREFRQRFALRR